MSGYNWAVEAGKQTLRERVFTYSTTEGVTAGGVAINADPLILNTAECMLTLDNQATINSGNNQFIMPVAFRMECVAPNSSDGSMWVVQFAIDNVTRWSSGGTTPPAAQNSYDTRTGYADRTPKGVVHFGDLTCVTDSAQKLVGRKILTSNGFSGFAEGDSFTFHFDGDYGSSGSQGNATYAAVRSGVNMVYGMPKIWVGRQCSLVAQILGLGSSVAPKFMAELVTIELGHPRQTA